jgi:hypothetical protein
MRKRAVLTGLVLLVSVPYVVSSSPGTVGVGGLLATVGLVAAADAVVRRGVRPAALGVGR